MVRFHNLISENIADHAIEWGRKISYCIAFSRDGATDVTRRYVPNLSQWGERSRTSEASLIHILQDICTVRRKELPIEERCRLTREDKMEAQEMSISIAKQATVDVCQSVPGWQAGLGHGQLQQGILQKQKVIDFFISF
jgi:hypothetical protein